MHCLASVTSTHSIISSQVHQRGSYITSISSTRQHTAIWAREAAPAPDPLSMRYLDSSQADFASCPTSFHSAHSHATSWPPWPFFSPFPFPTQTYALPSHQHSLRDNKNQAELLSPSAPHQQWKILCSTEHPWSHSRCSCSPSWPVLKPPPECMAGFLQSS